MPHNNPPRRRWHESETNAREANIPMSKARQIAKHLADIAAIAEEYGCQIFISPGAAGLYHSDRMFGKEPGAGVQQQWEIIGVCGPFDGGDF